MNKKILEKLFILKKNQILLAKDRGYLISLEEKRLLEFKNFSNKFEKYKDVDDIYDSMKKEYQDEDGKKYIFIFLQKHKLNKKNIIEVFQEENKDKFSSSYEKIILIGEQLTKSQNTKLIQRIDFEFFTFSEISRRIVDHINSPEYIKLNENEKQQLFDDLNCDEEQLPKFGKIISESPYFIEDPVVKHYGWGSGDVIKIIRKMKYINTGIDKKIYYRVVR